MFRQIDLHVLYLLVPLLASFSLLAFLSGATWVLIAGAAVLLLFPQGIILVHTIDLPTRGRVFSAYLVTHEVLTAFAGLIFVLTWMLCQVA